MLLSSILSCGPVKFGVFYVSATSIMHRGLEQVHYILVWMVVRAAEGTGLENQRAATPSRGIKSPTIRGVMSRGICKSRPRDISVSGNPQDTGKTLIFLPSAGLHRTWVCT